MKNNLSIWALFIVLFSCQELVQYEKFEEFEPVMKMMDSNKQRSELSSYYAANKRRIWSMLSGDNNEGLRYLEQSMLMEGMSPQTAKVAAKSIQEYSREYSKQLVEKNPWYNKAFHCIYPIEQELVPEFTSAVDSIAKEVIPLLSEENKDFIQSCFFRCFEFVYDERKVLFDRDMFTFGTSGGDIFRYKKVKYDFLMAMPNIRCGIDLEASDNYTKLYQLYPKLNIDTALFDQFVREEKKVISKILPEVCTREGEGLNFYQGLSGIELEREQQIQFLLNIGKRI